MAKKRDETKPYKQVIIMGPDHNGAFAGHRSIEWGDHVLVIGDGKKEVTLDEIRDQLTDKINECTRIDILAHGGIDPSNPVGNHSIWLSNNQGTSTASFFKLLSEVNLGKPVYTHLWACYADNADKEFSHLPPDSIAVFHSSKNAVGYGTQIDQSGELISKSELRYDEHDYTLEGVKRNLNLSLNSTLLMGGSLKFGKSNKTYSVKYVIPETVDSESGYLDFIHRYFHESGERHLVFATDDIEKDCAGLCKAVNDFMKSDEMKEPTDKDFIRKMRDLRNYYAMYLLITYKNISNLKTILESSKGKGLVNIQGPSLHTPIFFAKSPEAVALLVKHGADLNHKDTNGHTALSNAVTENNTEVIEALLKYGADPNVVLVLGFTPIYFAKSPKAVELLAKYGANLNQKQESGFIPLTFVNTVDKSEVLEALLKAGVNPFINGSYRSNELILKFIDKQPDLLSYLIKCNDNNVVTSMHSILLLRENAPNLYQKLDRTKVKEFLNETIHKDGHKTATYKDKEGEKITNFRKIIKAGNIESLELALSFNPTVTLSDIKMAKTIYKPLPTKIYEAMNKLNEELPQKQEKFEKLFNEELTKLEANPESYTIKDAVAAMRRAFKSDQLDRDALKEKFEEAKKAKAKPWVNRLLSTRSSASAPGSWSRYATKKDTGGKGRDI